MTGKILRKIGTILCIAALFVGQQVSMYGCTANFYQPVEPEQLRKYGEKIMENDKIA